MVDKAKKIFSLNNIYVYIAVMAGVYHVYTGLYRTINPQFDRSIHLLFGLCLMYIASIGKRKSKAGKALDVFSILLSFAVCLYIIINYRGITERWGTPNAPDLVFGVLAILLIIDMGRRTIGLTLPIIAVIFLLYAYFGKYFPGFMGHAGYSVKRIIHQMYLTMQGVWGIPLGVSASNIFLFLLFGSFINTTGIGQFYIDLATALFGQSKGGAAKVGVVASGLMGSVSGSAVANAAAVGSITIPMMKKMGYEPEFAGAVEAAASTGGQIMPPIMGAGAFVMAEFLAVPFSTIMIAALIPAIVYYIALYFSVHFEACKIGLKGNKIKKWPVLKPLLKRSYLLSPVLALFILLIPLHWTAMRTAIAGIVICIIIAIIDKETKFNFKTAVDACVDTAKNAVVVISSCAMAGLVVGVINLTGLGLKLTDLIISLGGSNLFLVLSMVMVTCIIMGMGLPTTPSYIIVAVLGAPLLIKMGVVPIAAHMFVFYFGILSMITPPVALAVYTACGIAGADFWKTGLLTVKIALPVFLMPFMFVYQPVLLAQGTWYSVLFAAITAIIGSGILAASTSGWLIRKTTLLERLGLFVSALLMINANTIVTFVGIIGFALILFYQKLTIKQNVSNSLS